MGPYCPHFAKRTLEPKEFEGLARSLNDVKASEFQELEDRALYLTARTLGHTA